jgi:hypothetical protein
MGHVCCGLVAVAPSNSLGFAWYAMFAGISSAGSSRRLGRRTVASSPVLSNCLARFATASPRDGTGASYTA